jgi:rubrerythrin
MNLKGTKSQANLMAAFAGESQARNKYTYYASKAKKEGYEQIAALFLETANNEKEHAKIWFKLLHDGIADTATNLKDAAAGETMSGPICMRILLKMQEKKALKNWQFFLKVLLKSKNSTRKDILNC